MWGLAVLVAVSCADGSCGSSRDISVPYGETLRIKDIRTSSGPYGMSQVVPEARGPSSPESAALSLVQHMDYQVSFELTNETDHALRDIRVVQDPDAEVVVDLAPDESDSRRSHTVQSGSGSAVLDAPQTSLHELPPGTSLTFNGRLRTELPSGERPLVLTVTYDVEGETMETTAVLPIDVADMTALLTIGPTEFVTAATVNLASGAAIRVESSIPTDRIPEVTALEDIFDGQPGPAGETIVQVLTDNLKVAGGTDEERELGRYLGARVLLADLARPLASAMVRPETHPADWLHAVGLIGHLGGALGGTSRHFVSEGAPSRPAFQHQELIVDESDNVAVRDARGDLHEPGAPARTASQELAFVWDLTSLRENHDVDALPVEVRILSREHGSIFAVRSFAQRTDTELVVPIHALPDGPYEIFGYLPTLAVNDVVGAATPAVRVDISEGSEGAAWRNVDSPMPNSWDMGDDDTVSESGWGTSEIGFGKTRYTTHLRVERHQDDESELVVDLDSLEYDPGRNITTHNLTLRFSDAAALEPLLVAVVAVRDSAGGLEWVEEAHQELAPSERSVSVSLATNGKFGTDFTEVMVYTLPGDASQLRSDPLGTPTGGGGCAGWSLLRPGRAMAQATYDRETGRWRDERGRFTKAPTATIGSIVKKGKVALGYLGQAVEIVETIQSLNRYLNAGFSMTTRMDDDAINLRVGTRFRYEIFAGYNPDSVAGWWNNNELFALILVWYYDGAVIHSKWNTFHGGGHGFSSRQYFMFQYACDDESGHDIKAEARFYIWKHDVPGHAVSRDDFVSPTYLKSRRVEEGRDSYYQPFYKGWSSNKGPANIEDDSVTVNVVNPVRRQDEEFEFPSRPTHHGPFGRNTFSAQFDFQTDAVQGHIIAVPGRVELSNLPPKFSEELFWEGPQTLTLTRDETSNDVVKWPTCHRDDKHSAQETHTGQYEQCELGVRADGVTDGFDWHVHLPGSESHQWTDGLSGCGNNILEEGEVCDVGHPTGEDGPCVYTAGVPCPPCQGEPQPCRECQCPPCDHEDCTDGVDNDHDGRTDCEDEDCEGDGCNDGGNCTTDETCIEGECRGQPVVCDEDDNPCTQASCDPETGNCVQGDLEGGTPCGDGGTCDGEGTCIMPVACSPAEEVLGSDEAILEVMPAADPENPELTLIQVVVDVPPGSEACFNLDVAHPEDVEGAAIDAREFTAPAWCGPRLERFLSATPNGFTGCATTDGQLILTMRFLAEIAPVDTPIRLSWTPSF